MSLQSHCPFCFWVVLPPQLLLHNPGTLVLKKGDETVELKEGVELALRWSVDGKSDSTRLW